MRGRALTCIMLDRELRGGEVVGPAREDKRAQGVLLDQRQESAKADREVGARHLKYGNPDGQTGA